MNPDNNKVRRLNIGQQILSYLLDHPEAKDSLEGIRQWWLVQEGDPPNQRDVLQALHQLMEKKWVIAMEFQETETVYGLNREKIDDIRTFLTGRWEGE